MSVPDPAARRVQALGVLSRFRTGLYGCMTARADAMFELCDALLCADRPVTSLADLTLLPEHRRGYGGMYDGLNCGRIEVGRLRETLAGLALPRFADARLVLAVDVSPWLRPDAACSPDRLFCHVYGRAKGQAQMIPGWPYSFVAALEPGRTSWTQLLDVVRLGPADDATAVTANQLREVVNRLIDAGQWKPGDPDIVIVCDAGYDVTRLTHVLRGLPVQLVGRIRADRILLFPTPARTAGTTGRPAKHGPVFALADPATWPDPHVTTLTDNTRYGTATASAWDRLHPRLTRRTCWLTHQGELPIIEGTLIRLSVEYLPGNRDPKPMWLWCSGTSPSPSDVDRCWQLFLRRFDLEHTFRLFKQTLGWACPRLRDPAAADRWSWIIVCAYTQLRLTRHLVEDLRRPWEKPAPPGRLSPARVRRGFRNIHAITIHPTSAPKPAHPGPGRPPGSTNRRPATRYDVGKTIKRDPSITAHQQRQAG